jgi:hypothetical protein
MELTPEFVRQLFAKLASPAPQSFFECVAENVECTVLGTHPLAGHCTSKRVSSEATFARLEAVYGPHPGLAGAAVLSCYRECQKTAPDCSQQEESPQYRTEFLALLDGEIGNFEKLQDLHQASRDELAAAHGETLSILPDGELSRILRYETFLDRQYERLLEQLQGSQADRGKKSRQSDW